jgi:hypothetical protein
VQPLFEFQPGLGVRISGELRCADSVTRFDEILPEQSGGMFTIKVKDAGMASFTLRYD